MGKLGLCWPTVNILCKTNETVWAEREKIFAKKMKGCRPTPNAHTKAKQRPCQPKVKISCRPSRTMWAKREKTFQGNESVLAKSKNICWKQWEPAACAPLKCHNLSLWTPVWLIVISAGKWVISGENYSSHPVNWCMTSPGAWWKVGENNTFYACFHPVGILALPR